MKKIFALLILTLLNINLFYSQNNKTKKADRLFERLEFVKASEEYLKILDNSPDNNYVIRKLADSYYNIFNTVEAEKWYSKLPKKHIGEDDMLDQAFEPKSNSRLSCQILITDELDGLVVNLPERQV